MMLYELIDMTEAKTITVLNDPYTNVFYLMQIDNGNTKDVNQLVYDAIESCDVYKITVKGDTMFIYLGEDHISIDTEWDKSGLIDFYDLFTDKADDEMNQLANSLGIYILKQ